MTKVTLNYDLSRPLNDDDLSAISNLPGVYGMARVQLAPSLDKLTVDYDASRLSKRDVEANLAHFGIPIRAAVS